MHDTYQIATNLNIEEQKLFTYYKLSSLIKFNHMVALI